MSMEVRILKLTSERDLENPLKVLKVFPSKPSAESPNINPNPNPQLTDALLYWDDHQLHKQAGTVITIKDEYNEVLLRLTRKLFEEL